MSIITNLAHLIFIAVARYVIKGTAALFQRQNVPGACPLKTSDGCLPIRLHGVRVKYFDATFSYTTFPLIASVIIRYV